MSAGKTELLCSKCRKRVSYEIRKRPAKTLIKDLEIEFEEYYGVCDECGAEIFVPGLEDQEEELLEEKYRKAKGLITIPEIKSVLERYNIEKRPLSKLIGFGELTITRYLDGQLPSKKYSDILYKILNDDQYMKMLVEENGDLVSNVTVKKVLEAMECREEIKKTDDAAERIALYVIKSGKEITNLVLQKVLYYIKGLSSLFVGISIIPEPCEAWKFGPVFPDVYEKYKEFGKQEIIINVSYEDVAQMLTESEKKITDYVLDTIGIYNAWFLKDLTHMEEPWIEARYRLGDNDASRNRMDNERITDYFIRINEIYNLKTPEGIDCYVNDMKKKMQRYRR